jgi:hypothetical protein
MIEQLFGSKTRVKLLQLFYQNPNRAYYVREITRKIDEQINSVRRELANLLSIGIITSDNANNKLYYEVNQTYDHYEALADMFGGKKSKKKKVPKKGTTGTSPDETTITEVTTEEAEDNPILQVLKKTGNVRLVIITGQFTLDDQSGVDIVIVGDLNSTNIEHAIKELEDQEKKELRYATFGVEEFMYRRQVNDRFISDIDVAKKIVLIDKDRLL